MNVKDKIEFLPHGPGVYRFLNVEGTVIYVGKAKDLKRRVSQYFRPVESLDRKTRVMVGKIADLQHTVVESEEDALLLENNLIKQLQPKYNILLKDSKTYPWICIKNEPFPRIYLTRRYVKDGSQYFGPYSSVIYAKGMLNLIGTLYKLRVCKLSLTPDNIASGKFRPCLNYHIGKCLAPCVGIIKSEEYQRQISSITSLLKGDVALLIKEYREEMKSAAAEMRFEQAQEAKEKIEALEHHYSKSLIVGQGTTDVDVFSLVIDNFDVFCNFMRIKGGCIIQSFNMEMKMKIEQSEEELLSIFMGEIISKFGELSKEILVPFMPDQSFDGKNVHIPQKGDKSSLLELSRKNAAELKFNKMKQEEYLRPDDHRERIVSNLQKDLGMKVPPVHIECFDNSNIQGTDPVASCVVFKNGVPSKKDYRHFNIKTVVGANDYASMKEVVNRRYSRLMAEGEPLPQLVVIDGGRGQLNFALEALLELGLSEEIHIIGIAKRLEEIIVPGDPHPLFLDKNSSSLRVLMSIRDEAHRFGITHHRGKRSTRQLSSQLSKINGVGPKTEEKLLLKFKSVARIKKASFEELSKEVGKSIAQAILDYFSGNS
ncbi:MAG: excinuclease ABC subunit UvrC [Bacteroidales bacterium]|nr:excinuclease ABC subunit UvrC [Bacteroidales bacterium]MDD3200556.1 excinuclease ABC subunit UvrC [Bacteroidales bacterium]